MQALGADSCYRAGRAARVVLEAARLQQLAAAGFSTALVEYVGSVQLYISHGKNRRV